MQTNSSQVARLRARIEAESAAAQWAMKELAEGNVRYKFIARRIERMQQAGEQLAELVGKQEAMILVMSKLNDL